MKATQRNFDYLKSLDAVLINDTYIITDVSIDPPRAWINRRQNYRKRNGKVCYIDYKGDWITIPFSCIRTKRTEKQITSGFAFQTDDIYTMAVEYHQYIAPEFKGQLIDQYITQKKAGCKTFTFNP